MTLKTDYTTNLTDPVTGALPKAFNEGSAFVTTNLALLSSSLTTAAAAGQTTFTVFITTSYLPEALKLNGNLLKSYLDGIYAGLTAQGIYRTYEVTLSLDTSTVGTNKIKFNFTFTL